MGLLKFGQPLEWRDTVVHSKYVREHGIKQFLATWNRVKDLENDRLYYGDEIEYSVVKVDTERREVRLSLRGHEILEVLRARESNNQPGIRGCTWHQEYGSWMIEGTPALPYGGYTSSLVQVEQNMRLRRARILSALAPDEMAPTLVSFPLMGVGEFVHPCAPPGGPASESEYVPDACINPHPRFGTLTANIRARRGAKVDIRVPLFQEDLDNEADDEESPAKGSFNPPPRVERSQTDSVAKPDDCAAPEIQMDCMAFGMGCCCLQVTFQASDVTESRYLYDQLATIAPILLALTAATPIYRGRLAGIDVRWNVIAAAVDDRTPAERGEVIEAKPDPHMVGGGVQPMSKSRYDSISRYISEEYDTEHYNDVPCEVDEDIKNQLVDAGIDETLALHLAHLFTRDPLVCFAGAVEEVNDEQSMEHFESINSTNWQTVRWKPPPPPQATKAAHIGWRTEFRSMEVQLTDFENAAFTAFIVLITMALLVFDLDLVMPLSKVDENMQRAHVIDAVKHCRFWFRKHVLPELSVSRRPSAASVLEQDTAPQPSTPFSPDGEEMTMDQIINGKGDFYPGLVPLCYAYLEHIQCDGVSFVRLASYLNFISKRASGELMTPAAWMRKFVREHKDYKKDSVVTQGIAYDLMHACDEIGRGQRPCPELHGDVVIEPIVQEGNYDVPLTGSSDKGAILNLLRQLRNRAAADDGPGSGPQCPMRRRHSTCSSTG